MNYEPKPSMLNPTIPQVDSEEIVEYEEIDDADIIELVGVEPTFGMQFLSFYRKLISPL